MQTPILLSFHNYLKSREDFTEKLITRFKFFLTKSLNCNRKIEKIFIKLKALICEQEILMFLLHKKLLYTENSKLFLCELKKTENNTFRSTINWIFSDI